MISLGIQDAHMLHVKSGHTFARLQEPESAKLRNCFGVPGSEFNTELDCI